MRLSACLWGTPVSSSRSNSVFFLVGRYPSFQSQVLFFGGGEGTPSPATGVVQSPVPGPAGGKGRGRAGTQTGQDRGIPQTDQGYLLPWQDRGYPPPKKDRRVSEAMPWVVCLLRSCRRTFLFHSCFQLLSRGPQVLGLGEYNLRAKMKFLLILMFLFNLFSSSSQTQRLIHRLNRQTDSATLRTWE